MGVLQAERVAVQRPHGGRRMASLGTGGGPQGCCVQGAPGAMVAVGDLESHTRSWARPGAVGSRCRALGRKTGYRYLVVSAQGRYSILAPREGRRGGRVACGMTWDSHTGGKGWRGPGWDGGSGEK